MFRKVLVANRGEIAVRVIRACRELGIATVAVYATADTDALHVKLADEAVCIGPAAAKLSYLHIPNVVGAALKTAADAIHPGYGFLSEDPYFAEICAENGIVFIGPSAETIELAGSKTNARRVMAQAGLSVLPGTPEPVASARDAVEAGAGVGFPLMIKAVAGGGGRGIALVRERGDLEPGYRKVRANAQALFGDSRVYLERYLNPARHIEFQVLCDHHGHAIHLGERDCSVQRRNQKLVEEAPSPALTPALRAEMGAAVLSGAKALGYRGAGTFEFLLGEDERFWFMEINPRIQVEHPVTEMVTGVDLVAEQIKIAAGIPLSLTQSDITMTGHAIETRINAEDPSANFRPTPGTIAEYRPPGGPGIRIDSHCVTGSVITPHYDSLIAKVIAFGSDRSVAIERMAGALGELRAAGPNLRTTAEFLRRIVTHPQFRAGEANTGFLAAHPELRG